METINFVSKLNNYAQEKHFEPRYEDLGSSGTDHNKTFSQKVVINGKDYPVGVGKTKKDAKRNAAENALKCLLAKEHQDSANTTEEAAEASAAPGHQTNDTNINYICWLNEYGQRNRVTIRPVESSKVGPNNTIQCCSFVVGETEYPAVSGKTRREAKEEAAKLVYDVINGSKTLETAAEFCSRTSTQRKEELSIPDISNATSSLSLSSDSSFQETNYIGLVNHHCQRERLNHSYVETRRCGRSDMPQFFFKLVINNKEYPEAKGKSIKEAKQNAAQLAWSALHGQSDWNNEVSFSSTASEDGAPPTSSASSATWESNDSSSQSMSVNSDGSIIFTDSSNPFKVQAIKDTNVGSRQNETKSRFTTDFDSMVKLGSGGFGWVWKARHKVLDKYYAVKIVRGEEKCLREVRVLSDLQHDNIVRYYHCWLEDSGYQWAISDDSWSSSQSAANSTAKFLYIQLELCDTKTLEVWIAEKNDQTPQDRKRREESLNIAQQIVRGVEYIHSKEKIHRDLKPANILFGLDGKVKIGDFGLVTRDDALMDKTADRGTPIYMAPEQMGKKYGRKVDIFPLGLIYLELLWKVSTGSERIKVLQDAKDQTLPDEFSLTFPREKKIIEKMLCRKPENRPEASELRAELEKWAETFSAQNMCQRNATV